MARRTALGGVEMSKSEDCRWREKGRQWEMADAREALAAQAASGLTDNVFAEQHGFSGQRLRQWRKRLGLKRPHRGGRERPATTLIPMVVRQARESSSDALTGGVVMRLGRLTIEVHEPTSVDASWLARLVVEIGGAA
jgi:hypothetical protein